MKLNFIKDFFSKNFKYVLYGLGLLVLLILGQEYLDGKAETGRLHRELIGQTEKFKKLTQHSANLERKYVEQTELRRLAERTFSRERDSLKGRIKVLSNATYLIRERARKSNSSDLVYESRYVFNEIRFNKGPPVGYVIIFNNGRVVSKVYNYEIDVKTAISRDEDSGRYSVLSRADFVLRSGHRKPDGKNWFGVPFPLKISGGTAFIDPTEPVRQRKRFYLWSPRYNLGANVSPDGVAPGLGLSLMGYGFSKRDLDFKFVQLGLQYEKKDGAGLTVTPVLWRPFADTLSNTYVGLGMSVDGRGQNYFMGLSVGF